MHLLRWPLIFASLILGGWVAEMAIYNHPKPAWVGLVIPLGCVLNIAYIFTSGRGASGQPSRLLRLVSLWMDAKEEEFRRRAKSSD